MNEPITEAEVVNPQAVAVRPEAGAVNRALPADQIKAPVTAAQAKVDAVAALTMSAYERAATLELTPEEAAKLQADFPDEAFQTGAAGKENLIYIEHAHLRERFNSVFGMGKWAIVPRSRWAEPFTTKGYPGKPPQEGSRVYVEAMLVIRGCFVGEAVGAMEYYPSNAAQNYGDAVEGAKTAAFRRCAKEFGVGLQAWKKDFCEGWWQRKRAGQRQNNAPGRAAAPPTSQHPAQAPKASPAPAAAQPAAFPTTESKAKMISALKAGPGEPSRAICTDYFLKCGQLQAGQEIESLPLRFVPLMRSQMNALADKIAGFGNGEQAAAAFPPHQSPAPGSESTPAAAAARPVYQGGATVITGTIERVTTKDGKSSKGPWTLYGINIGGAWFNTFSNTVGGIAQDLTGKQVELRYTEDDKGKTAVEVTPIEGKPGDDDDLPM